MKLLEHFKELSLHPNNAEELKGLILKLAMTGRLTSIWRSANPNVKSAKELFQEEKPLGFKRKRKNFKDANFTLDSRVYSELPISWIYATVKELYDGFYIINYADGNHGSLYPRKGDFGDQGTLFVTAKQINKLGKVEWDKVDRLKQDKAELLTKGWAECGDVLLTHNATVGRVAHVEPNEIDEPFLLGTSATYYRLNKDYLNQRFLYYVFCSPVWQDQLKQIMQQTTRNQVSIQKQAHFKIPIPPLEEQKAIVKVVNTLFKEVEQLESLTKERIQLKESFVVSASNRLTEAENTQQEWNFLQQHFSSFFTEKKNIKSLREAILQLAVQGKLTKSWREENSNVESASILFYKIQEEKAELVKEKKIRNERVKKRVAKSTTEFDVPNTWKSCNLTEVYYTIGGKENQIKTNEYLDKGYYPVVSQGKKLIEGYSNDKSKVLRILKPVVVFGDHTRVVKLIDFDFIIGADGVKILAPCSHILSEYFFFYLSSIDLNSRGYARHYSHLKNESFSLPPLEEQKAIVEKVNSLMALCDELEQQIHSSQIQIEQLMQSCLKEVFEHESN